MIPLYDSDSRTCLSCAYGFYHRAQSGALESPPQPAYCTCRHPRVCCEMVYDPNEPPVAFECRYWAVQDGADSAGMDAEVMDLGVWLGCWRLDWETGELMTV